MASIPSLKTAPVHPSMAYQPLNSPDLGYRIDGEENDRGWKVSFHFATAFRLVVALLALVDIIIWCIVGISGFRSVTLVFIELFLVLAWNLVLLLPQSRFVRGLPTVVCQVGDCAYVLNENGLEEGRARKPQSRRQKRQKFVLTAIVDLAFGLSIVIIMATGWPELPYWVLNYTSESLFPISIVVGTLELVLALISVVACFWRLVFEFGFALRHVDDPDKATRIQLPPDTADRRMAGGAVSVAA